MLGGGCGAAPNSPRKSEMILRMSGADVFARAGAGCCSQCRCSGSGNTKQATCLLFNFGVRFAAPARSVCTLFLLLPFAALLLSFARSFVALCSSRFFIIHSRLRLDVSIRVFANRCSRFGVTARAGRFRGATEALSKNFN